MSSEKITSEHLSRKAVVYVRQSSMEQVRHNLESPVQPGKRLQVVLGRKELVAGGRSRPNGVRVKPKKLSYTLVTSVPWL